jgi:hypothetical protein
MKKENPLNWLLDSTLWLKPRPTLFVWITLAVLADEYGLVTADDVVIARRANVSFEEFEEAMRLLQEPEAYPRIPNWQGRRVELIKGIGWQLLDSDGKLNTRARHAGGWSRSRSLRP